MKAKIDFKKIAMVSAGQLGGLAVASKLANIEAIKKIEKPVLKGAIMFAVGALGVPYLSQMTGMNKKGSDDLVNGLGSGVAIYGLSLIGNTLAPKIFPVISGVDGYEDSVYGMGLITDEDNAVEGYEDAVYGADDDDAVYGADDDDDN